MRFPWWTQLFRRGGWCSPCGFNEETDFDVVTTGLCARAKLDDSGFLVVSVRRKTFIYDAATKERNWFWLFVSGVTVYLPISKAEAMRIVYHHLALHDQALIPTTAALWNLWDEIPERSDAAPPQNTTLN